MQSASNTFSEVLIISNSYKHRARRHEGGKVDGPLAEVPSISIEYCEVYRIPRRVEFTQVPGPWSPGPLFLPT